MISPPFGSTIKEMFCGSGVASTLSNHSWWQGHCSSLQLQEILIHFAPSTLRNKRMLKWSPGSIFSASRLIKRHYHHGKSCRTTRRFGVTRYLHSSNLLFGGFSLGGWRPWRLTSISREGTSIVVFFVGCSRRMKDILFWTSDSPNNLEGFY